MIAGKSGIPEDIVDVYSLSPSRRPFTSGFTFYFKEIVSDNKAEYTGDIYGLTRITYCIEL